MMTVIEPTVIVGPERIHTIMTAYLQSKAVFAALEGGIFEELERRPQSLEDLAASLGLERRPTQALVRALRRLELIEGDDDRLRNSAEAADYLVASSPRYMGGFAEHQNAHFASFAKLEDAVRENTSVNRRVLRDGYRDQGAAEGEGAEGTARLMSAMRVSSRMQADLLARALPDDLTTVADVGCGSGDYSIALAQARPEVAVTCVDYPAVCRIVERNVVEAGCEDRVTVHPVDVMTGELPMAQDVLLSHVLDGYGDDRAAHLLRRIHERLPLGGRVFVHGHMPSLASGPFPSLFGLILLVNTDTGEVHDVAEIESWLTAAGFEVLARQTVSALSGLVVARK